MTKARKNESSVGQLTEYYGPVVWMMLAWARGVRDLRHIHDLLEARYRILREDLLMLDRRWKQLNGGKTSIGGERPEDEVILHYMNSYLKQSEIRKYYKSKFSGRVGRSPNQTVWIRVSQVSHQDLSKHGDLFVTLPDLPRFWAECSIEHVTGTLWVTLTLEDKELIEPVTRKLLDHAVLSAACNGPSRGQFPEKLSFTFDLSAEGVHPFLGQFRETRARWERNHIPGLEGILHLLQNKLEAAGLEGVELAPLEYEEHGWYCDTCEVRGFIEYSPYNYERKSVDCQVGSAHWHRRRPNSYQSCRGIARVLAEASDEEQKKIVETYLELEPWRAHYDRIE